MAGVRVAVEQGTRSANPGLGEQVAGIKRAPDSAAAPWIGERQPPARQNSKRSMN